MATPPVAPPALQSPAIFVAALQNNGTAASVAQYVSFGHCFQKGQLTQPGLSATIGGTTYPCQVDTKTKYADGSPCFAVLTLKWPAVPASSMVWGQFAPSAAPSGSVLTLPGALGSTTASVSLAASALPDWAANTTYSQNALVRPTVGNAGGYTFQYPSNSNGTTGTSGATEPVWPQTVGAAVVDGTMNNTGSNPPSAWVNIGKPFTGTIAQDLIAAVKAVTPDLWLSGPLAVQGRVHVLASNPGSLASATTNASLPAMMRLLVDVAAYADGTVMFDLCIANDAFATLITSGAPAYSGTQQYAATVTLNGNNVLVSSSLAHSALENWAWQFGTLPHLFSSSQDTTLQVVHNPADFIEAQAIVPYDTTVSVGVGTFNDVSYLSDALAQTGSANFAKPMSVNGYLVNNYMPGVGVSYPQDGIGPNNYWQTWALLTGAQGFWAAGLECARINGTIPWHEWNPNTGRYWSNADDPNLSASGNWQGLATSTLHLVPTATADGIWALDFEHYPDLVYVAYLTTGRRYILDELAAVTLYSQRQDMSALAGYGLEPVPANITYINAGLTCRAQGWGLRHCVYAAYACADSDAQKSWFRKVLDDTLYAAVQSIRAYQSMQGDCYGWLPANYGGLYEIAPWQDDYTMFAVGLAAAMGHPLALQLAWWMLHFRTGVLLNGASWPPNGFPTADAVIYDMEMWSQQQVAWGNGNFTHLHWPPAQSWTGLAQFQRLMSASAVNSQSASNTCNCIFTGTISGTTLTVNSVTAGALAVGMQVFAGPGTNQMPTIASGSGTSWSLTLPSGFSAPGAGVTMSASDYNVPGQYVFWYDGLGQGGGNTDNYDQVLYDALIQGEVLGHPDATAALNTLVALTDTTGAGVPNDLGNAAGADWQNALIWKLASRTWNDSQIFPAAGAANGNQAQSLAVAGPVVAVIPAAPGPSWTPSRRKRVYFGNRR